MKILQVVDSINPAYGGIAAWVASSTPALTAAGHHTTIVCLDRPGDPWLAAGDPALFALGENRLRYRYSRKFSRWLEAHADEFDVAIVHGLWGYATVGAARVLQRKAVPYFVYSHGMLDPYFRSVQPLKIHAKQLYWTLFLGPALRAAKAVLFTAEDERRLAQGAFKGYRYNELVLPIGVPDISGDAASQIAAFRQAAPALGDRAFLLFLGRIHPKKGCDLLIRGFSRVAAAYPDVDLVIAGPDETGLRAELERLAATLGVGGRIHWLGMVTGDVKWGALHASQAFVLPSHQENFGVAVAEAMACGTPALVTDKINIWREVQDGGAGLVGGDDLTGVTRMIAEFLALPAHEKQALGENARHCFERNFRLTTAVGKLLHTMLKTVAFPDRLTRCTA